MGKKEIVMDVEKKGRVMGGKRRRVMGGKRGMDKGGKKEEGYEWEKV